jgi:ribosomal protein L17
MNFPPKNFPWGRLVRILTLGLAFSILAISLTMASLETAAKNDDDNNLRVNPISFDYLNEKGEVKQNIYKTPESSVAANSLIYPIKNMRDDLWIKMSTDGKKKTEIYLLIADKKIKEANDLYNSKSNEKFIVKTANEALNNLKEAKSNLKDVQLDKTEIDKINQQLMESGRAYERIIKSWKMENEEIDKTIVELESINEKK